MHGRDTAPGTSPLPLLALAVLATATSAPLAASAAAAPLALAFWRSGLSVLVLLPFAMRRSRAAQWTLDPAAARAAALAGLALSVHYVAWMTAAQLSTVTAATALVCTQPIWQAVIAARAGHRMPQLAWAGIGIAVAGAVVAAGSDFQTSVRALTGDLLAVLAAIAAAAYTACGERARRRLPTSTFGAISNSACCVVVLAGCLLFGTPLTGYTDATWLIIVALVVGAQLAGQTVFAHLLRTLAATAVSLAILTAMPIAAALAWLTMEQAPTVQTGLGAVVLVIGVALFLLSSLISESTLLRRARPTIPRRSSDRNTIVVHDVPPVNDSP
ncbi:DMT family transporter [Amycolatopsis sp. CA-230715]|uniref:DMT family transporter n=1 Tax=Amycolatopsis sp. CA-230715 TaxID=2745196 RepID=UPI001C03423E|nr:DMT family transporter [Amycolatopsis sp. CA-230715]QWF85787.1 hypothetical protein HUW46_09267 [Amycolatopsis sp. CA-230715]